MPILFNQQYQLTHRYASNKIVTFHYYLEVKNNNMNNQTSSKEQFSFETEEALKKYNLWYSSLSKERKKIESDIKYFEKGRHFGTILDELNPKKTPTIYIGLDFKEMGHDQVRKFFMATDREKFEMAYWAQNIHSRRSFKFGVIFSVFIISIIYYLLIRIISY